MIDSSRRIQGADGIRALACLLVFFHHFVKRLPAQDSLINRFLRTDASLGVAMFFVLSGLLLSIPFWKSALGSSPAPSLANYILSRLGRIVPGYSVCLILTTLRFGSEGHDCLWRLTAGLTFTNWMHWRTFFPAAVNDPLWSISIEVWFYALLPIWAIVLQRLRNFRLRLLWVLASMGSLALLQRLIIIPIFQFPVADNVDGLQSVGAEWLPVCNPLGLFAHFLWGTLAAGIIVRWPARCGSESTSDSSRRRINWHDGMVLLLLTILAADLFPVSPGLQFLDVGKLWFMRYDWPVFPGLIAALLVFLHHSACIGRLFDNRLFVITAKLSFGIYLWHKVILVLLERTLFEDLNSPLSQCLYLVSALTLSFGLASASYEYVEAPVLAFIKRRQHSQRRVLAAGCASG